jgi:DNA-binding YbaB/EbfC family protein
MRNLASMMQKAKEVQNNLERVKEELVELRFTGSAGGGAVEVEVNGRADVTNVTLSPDIIGVNSSDDVAMLEDLIQIAVNDARSQAENAKAEKMKEVTGGLPLPPGLDLPL